MKKFCTSLLLLVIVISIQAQDLTQNRIEFELKKDYTGHRVTGFGSDGLLLYARHEKLDQWKIERYDKDLKFVDDKIIIAPKKQAYSMRYTGSEHMYLLFKSKKGEYTLFKIAAEDLSVTKQVGTFPKKSIVKGMGVIDNMVFFSARIKKSPFMIGLDFEEGREKLIPVTVPGYKPDELFVENIQIYERNKQLFVYLNAKNKKEFDIYCLQINQQGDKVATVNLTEDIDYKLSSISASSLGNNQYIFTGTYSKRSVNTAEGMYISKMTDNEVDFTKTYNFLEFDDFLSYLPEKRQAKIEKKKAKKAKKGKELSFNYLMASHDMMIIGDKFIYVGEAYYPTYRTETYTTTGANGQTITQTRRVFDGFQYTHATVVAFDQEGNKLWDRNFELYPGYKPFVERKFLTISTENSKVNAMFASRNNIYSKTITADGEVENERKSEEIDSGQSMDKVKRSSSNIRHWYDNHFLAYGYQRIKNKSEQKRKKEAKGIFSKQNYLQLDETKTCKTYCLLQCNQPFLNGLTRMIVFQLFRELKFLA